MVGGILDLRALEVSDVMIHRTEMATINVDLAPEEIVKTMLATPHTRLPLWRDHPENIVGTLRSKDVLRTLQAAGGDATAIDIAAIMTPPWFVPDTTPVAEQLKAFRRRKTRFALVVDEYGQVMGLVTLDDIIGQIVGDISDEHDVDIPGVRTADRRLGACRRRGADPRSQPRDGLEPARRAGDHGRRACHSRGALDPGSGPELHLPRLPLPGSEKTATASRPCGHAARPSVECCSSAVFARRGGVDGERMHAIGQFR